MVVVVEVMMVWREWHWQWWLFTENKWETEISEIKTHCTTKKGVLRGLV